MMRINKKNVAIGLMAIAILLAGCGKTNKIAEDVKDVPQTESEESSEEPTFFVHPGVREEKVIAGDYPREWDHGSCKNIADRTVIVSIFLSDRTYSWDEDDENDNSQMQRELDSLAAATDWIGSQVEEYDISTDFVYDWNENPELKLVLSSDKDICNSEDEHLIWGIIEDNLDSNYLLEKYDADNILYMIVQNVPKNWDLDSFTWIYEEDEYPYEFTVMYQYRKGARVGAASYAHEILHAFGAHDLYIADEGETYVVTEQYLEHLRASGSMDIMFTVHDANGKSTGMNILGKFTPLDAYYVGIGEEPSEVEEYGLDKSEYR